MGDLPACRNCESAAWALVDAYTYGPNDRRARTFVCRECGAEARYFDGGLDPVVASGAMADREVWKA